MRALFRWALRLLPDDFAAEYGAELAETAEAHWRAEAQASGRTRRLRFWVGQTKAVLALALRLRLEGWTRGRRGPREGMTMDVVWGDLRTSMRSLLGAPGFTALTLLTLSLGIGASTAIFSAVRAVLLRDLPYTEADRIATVFAYDVAEGALDDGLSAANALDIVTGSERLSHVAVADPWSLDLTVAGRTESMRTWAVSQGFFDVMGATPMLGRTFTPDEFAEGNERVVVLGHRAWLNRFGGDPTIVGSTIDLDQQGWTVVGVFSGSFRYPDAAEAWIPRPPREWDDAARADNYLVGVGRLGDGATLEQAQAEADAIARALAEAYPDSNADTGFRLIPLTEHLFGDVRSPLLVLFGAVSLVMLVACANAAGLLVARGARREREFALRGALGASRARLGAQIVGESLLLAAGASTLGIAIAHGGVALIEGLGPDHLPRIDEIAIDGAVLAFAVASAALCALVAGAAPALRISRPDLRGALAGGSRGSTGEAKGHALRNRLVVAEIGLAVVLAIGAGLLTRSFANLLGEELGFEPENRLAVQVFAYDYVGTGQADFVNQVVSSVEALPGVLGVALTSTVPGADDVTVASIEIDVPFVIEERARPERREEPRASVQLVSRSYFDVMGIPVVAGREFDRTDRSDSRPVIVVNETLARRHFREASPLGERLVVRYGRPAPDSPEPPAREIVGVARDVRPLGYESQPKPEIYYPLSQVGTGSLTFVIHAAEDAAALTQPVLQAIWDANPNEAVYGAATVESLLSGWLRERRFNLMLFSSFAAVALALAAVGIYGLISFSVETRRGEIGVRRALGGSSSALVGLVLGEGLRLVAAGVALGVLGALVLTRFLAGMLYDVTATDPGTFAGLAAIMVGVATAATLVPAVRAMRMDPVVALRAE